ncbi:D-alanyl-D-alanine carboxypeptidase family protein [Paenibacillus sp. L3-i20]|uniref:D-alanyl-D-alanine carboxypeptidase family protein n=1 Tax=Paenibacillus sp. L3-i20 TaxID=2905833 RepID=UPI001EDDFF97|nr:D-alanyl-D-alanine carboxypeptidase family protein [Paenibacillus sp. L3-i20]GKU78299.1 D-alanyl-D-alanine carboxypeptidase [Paenibacillus sp. L3-i20]
MGERKVVVQEQECSDIRHDVIQVNRSAIYEGHLVLINQKNPIKKQVSYSKLAAISSAAPIRELHQGILLEDTCLKQLVELIGDCEGMDDIIAVSGYRTKEEQEHIYESSLVENGAEYTACYVALPGQSEHHTGLAIDVGKRDSEIDFIAPSFPDSGVFKVFKSFAAQYGFIQRYKADKESITGISCEPWHFRYLGAPHAEIMEQRDMCLEEYIDFIETFHFEGKHLRYETVTHIVEIYYVPAEDGPYTTVPIISGDHFTLSGTNRDGFIVTVFTRKGQKIYGI